MLKRLLHKSCVWIMVTLLVLTNIDWTVYAVVKTTSEDETATYSINGVIFDDTNKNGEQDKDVYKRQGECDGIAEAAL